MMSDDDSQTTSSSSSESEKEEEEKLTRREEKNGSKWTSLEHEGPVFAPEYEPLPEDVHFKYDGEVMKLRPESEEAMTFYAKMLGHKYTSKEIFNRNFFGDWQKVMSKEEREVITDLRECNFQAVHEYLEKRKKDNVQKEYGSCTWDKKEEIVNFRLEPPSLFFPSRGDHPKMGKIKRRIQPEDIIINCSKNSKIPEPPNGHEWKEVKHDNMVTWLAKWTENVTGKIKYIRLHPNSTKMGEKDLQKYETARKLKEKLPEIRQAYWEDMNSPEMAVKQRAVALYLIDEFALRAGKDKKKGEGADTVECCSLRCEHIKTHRTMDMKNVIEFDFLGKNSIPYREKVPVKKQVFENLELFMENKGGEDKVFDKLTTAMLNKYLKSLMDGLTAKVFRTCNACITLQRELNKLTNPDDTPDDHVLAFNKSIHEVAILCNHKRAAPKKDIESLEEDFTKLSVQATDRKENMVPALDTSKINYVDPRIIVAWCRKWKVPIEKVYNKAQREKFAWAIAMEDETYEF